MENTEKRKYLNDGYGMLILTLLFSFALFYIFALILLITLKYCSISKTPASLIAFAASLLFPAFAIICGITAYKNTKKTAVPFIIYCVALIIFFISTFFALLYIAHIIHEKPYDILKKYISVSSNLFLIQIVPAAISIIINLITLSVCKHKDRQQKNNPAN